MDHLAIILLFVSYSNILNCSQFLKVSFRKHGIRKHSETDGMCREIIFRAESSSAPSQWETSLQSNAIYHWLGANLESALICWHQLADPHTWWTPQYVGQLHIRTKHINCIWNIKRTMKLRMFSIFDLLNTQKYLSVSQNMQEYLNESQCWQWIYVINPLIWNTVS